MFRIKYREKLSEMQSEGVCRVIPEVLSRLQIFELLKIEEAVWSDLTENLIVKLRIHQSIARISLKAEILEDCALLNRAAITLRIAQALDPIINSMLQLSEKPRERVIETIPLDW